MVDIIDQSGKAGDWADKTIGNPDSIAAQDVKFVKDFAKYTVSNPHPGFGKDPNIINEYGHTVYPKWITKPNGDKVIVNSKEEEDQILNPPKPIEENKEENISDYYQEVNNDTLKYDEPEPKKEKKSRKDKDGNDW